ncbi:hypothetical protein [Arsukibacterium ikkense]|uniref:hypothetical protein n=1 Tax=Arsukibacterium ikkense TaxID=336831 RepID=UPI000699A2D3|nr:hypothetical protein [Arsukibacterium ikkense]
MTTPPEPPQLTTPLRQQAELQLSIGAAPLSSAFVASTDALSVLYRLSSSADTASDGLKLLHELQVHQVELGLQLEQQQHNEREFNHELSCYQQFFAINPVACLILSTDGIITTANATATRFFAPLTTEQTGSLSKALCGSSLLSLLSAACRPLFSAALARVQRNQHDATLLVTTACHVSDSDSDSGSGSGSDNNAGAANLRLSISLSPDHKAILIMLT